MPAQKKNISEIRAKLPYRETVGIMLVNKRGRVWVGQRSPKWQTGVSDHIWQMPQGGIMDGENLRQAALRELKEEVGTDNVKILGKSTDWLSYDLPDDLLGIALGGKYRGHTYIWYAMLFLGKDSEIDISDKNGFKAEFDDWRWVRIREIEPLGIFFKEKMHRQVILQFRDLVKKNTGKKNRKARKP